MLGVNAMNQMIADPMTAYFGPVTPKDFAAFRAELLELYKPPQRAKATYRGMKQTLDELAALGIRSTADLTLTMVSQYIATRPPTLSPNSVRGKLRYVQALCTLAEKLNYLRPSPFRIRGIGQWIRAVPPAAKKFSSREDIRRVLDHAKSKITGGGWREWKARRDYAFLCTLAWTGCRYSEAVYMQAQDASLEENLIAIVSRQEHRLKTAGAHATVPLLSELRTVLVQEWLPHRLAAPPDFELDDPNCPWLFPTLRRHKRAPWNSGGPGGRPSQRVSILAAEVGVRLCPLMLRHSWASHLAAAGAGEHVIKQWLRHSNTQTQRWYVHPLTDAMRELGSKVGY
jgi:integrase